MKIINLSQRDDLWKDWRRQGITASDAAILLGRSPYKTLWRLWAEKTGYATEEDLSGNPLVQQGIRNEDLARQAFEARHDDLLLPVCVESIKHPLMRASLDGLRENGEPVELKCPSKATWEQVCAKGEDSDAFQLYYPQVQHQILVTGAAQGWLCFYHEDELKEFLVARDDELLEELLQKAEEFWELVEKRQEPPKDPERDLYIPTGSAVGEWIFAAEQYRLYEAQIKDLKAKLKQLEDGQAEQLNTLKSLMGDFYHADYAGVMVTRSIAAGRVNYKKLIEDKLPGITDAEIERYRGSATERCRVTVTDSVKPRLIQDAGTLAALEDVPDEVESAYF